MHFREKGFIKEEKNQMPLYQKTFGSTYTITNPFVSGWLLILFGVVFGCIGLAVQWNTVMFFPGSISTTGTVIRCDMRTMINQGHSVTESVPVVSFQTQTGQHLTFEAAGGGSSCFEGDTVTVRYHPNDPQNARLNSNAWLVFVGIGSASVLLSLVYFSQGIIRKIRKSNTDDE